MNRKVKGVLFTSALGLALIVGSGSAQAQTSPIDDLNSEAGKLKTLVNNVIPPAIAALAFGAGAAFLKRIIYS